MVGREKKEQTIALRLEKPQVAYRNECIEPASAGMCVACQKEDSLCSDT